MSDDPVPHVMTIGDLPQDAPLAAGAFYRNHADQAGLAAARGHLTIVLPPAPYDHRDWRQAAARDLARAHTPNRVNIIAGETGPNLDSTLCYLASAHGVTGQYLEVAGT